MKTVTYFFISGTISAFAGFGALSSKDLFTTLTCLGIGIAVWVLFFWGWTRRAKRESAKRFREQMFSNYLRAQTDNRR